MPEIKLPKKSRKTASKSKSITLKPARTQKTASTKPNTQAAVPVQTPQPTQTQPNPLPQQNTQTTTPTPIPKPASAQPASIQPQTPQQNAGWDNWGTNTNDPFSGLGSGYDGQNTGFGMQQPGRQSQRAPQQKRQTPEERVQMIKKIYSEILGREPDTRDINYYKYSTLNEEQIKKQLLTSAEHKDLIKKGREYDKLKNQTDQAKTQAKMLEGQIKDQVEEFKQLNILLNEKNSYIQQLRQIHENTQQKVSSVPQCIQQQQESPTTPTLQQQQADTEDTEDTSQSSDSVTKVPPSPPTATFTDEIPQAKPKSSNRIKEVLTQFLSQFF